MTLLLNKNVFSSEYYFLLQNAAFLGTVIILKNYFQYYFIFSLYSSLVKKIRIFRVYIFKTWLKEIENVGLTKILLTNLTKICIKHTNETYI